MSVTDTIGVIPALPGQTVIRIWVDEDTFEVFSERWPVIAWRVYAGWAEPICTELRCSNEREFFVQPDGRLANLDGEGFYAEIGEAMADCIAEVRRLVSARAKR